MDYSFYLHNNIPDIKRLEAYGFKNEENQYIFKKDLSSGDMYVLIKLTAGSIDVRVIDKAFNDDFIPFGVKGSQCPEKAEAEAIIDDIITNCFKPVRISADIINYLSKKYGTKPEHPWDKFPEYCTFKTKYRQKWYAIIMNIPQSRLGLEGDNTADIINIKAGTEKINSLIDNRRYFPAYHMNKKNWITVLLDKDTDTESLKELLNESYNIVETPKKVHGNILP